MTSSVSAHISQRCFELRIRLSELRRSHTEWLGNYIEWERLSRKGEDLKAEISLAKCRFEAIQEEIEATQSRLKFWSRFDK